MLQRIEGYPPETIGGVVTQAMSNEAVCRFVEATGKLAAIGHLADAGALLRGQAGTTVVP